MAQLMVVPIRDKGDAVLIVSLRDDEPLIGYVTRAALEDYFQRDLTNCDAILLVQCNFQSFEIMLAAKSMLAIKSMGCERAQGSRPCIEMTLSDMRSNGCLLSGEALKSARADHSADRQRQARPVRSNGHRPAIACAIATVRRAMSACRRSTMRPSSATTPLPWFSGSSNAAMIAFACATSSAAGEKAVLQGSI
jgi:hypothetical protein